MTQTTEFQRLERAVRMIARHPFYPGKQDVVELCVGEIEERAQFGLLTSDQKARLIDLVRDGSPRDSRLEQPR